MEKLGASKKELWLWLLRRRRRFRVTGPSMRPILQPGDEVLVDTRAYRQHPPQVGDIVVVLSPDRDGSKLIKRVAAVLPDGRCELVGDNVAESTDSRHFGLVEAADIVGRVTSLFP